MTIIAQRQPADKPGPAIVESVLTTPEAQLERGRHAINDSHDKVPIKVVLIPTTYVEQGTYSTIQDRGKTFNALNKGFSLEIVGGDEPSVTCEITVEGVN